MTIKYSFLFDISELNTFLLDEKGIKIKDKVNTNLAARFTISNFQNLLNDQKSNNMQPIEISLVELPVNLFINKNFNSEVLIPIGKIAYIAKLINSSGKIHGVPCPDYCNDTLITISP